MATYGSWYRTGVRSCHLPPTTLSCPDRYLDLRAVPFCWLQVERMVASLLYFKGMALRQNTKYPHLNRWVQCLIFNIYSDYVVHI